MSNPSNKLAFLTQDEHSRMSFFWVVVLSVVIGLGLWWPEHLRAFPQKALVNYTVRKIPKGKGCSSKTVHFWPYVGKAKMCLRGGRLFQFYEIYLHFSDVCLQFLRINYCLSNTFWLYQHKAKYAPFLSYSLLIA